MFCAHCGCKICGSTLLRKGHEYPKYLSSTYGRSGINNPHFCSCHRVHQDQLVEVLLRKLQEVVAIEAKSRTSPQFASSPNRPTANYEFQGNRRPS
ncbi:MAG: zinc ribbon domain-containing protein [Planctomycetales bacterium]|nr:zinc ribbon domain-containing protein [Planctomycetales bacterium]